jgi:hypothetical protein
MTILIISYFIIGLLIGIALAIIAMGKYSYYKTDKGNPIGRKIDISLALKNLKSVNPGQYMVFKQDVDLGTVTSLIDHDEFKIHNNFESAL